LTAGRSTLDFYLNSKRYRADGEYADEGLEGEDGGYPDDLPEVSVAGVMVPLLEVTEDHQSQMTTEEYEAYYNICQQLQ
jgi:transcription initiation factor TFIIE subunit alpha